MTTIRDIARRLELNPSTVSRAFSNPELVSEVTRSSILRVADEMNYSPNRIARQLRQNDTNNIGLIVDIDGWSWFSDQVVSGVQSATGRYGYNVLIWSSQDGEGEKKGLRFFSEMRFAGVVVAHTQVKRRDLSGRAFGLPVVYVNQEGSDHPSIYPDEEGGVHLMMEYLYGLGHRRIAYICGPASSYHAELRYRYFCRFMQRRCLPLRQEWVACGTWERQSGYLAAKAILACPRRPSVIVSANDTMAIGVYDAAREAGVSVPGQLSVVGHDGQEFAQWVYPKLTTCTLPLEEMCSKAVELLNSMIAGQTHSLTESIYVPGRLIIRDSAAEPLEHCAAGPV